MSEKKVNAAKGEQNDTRTGAERLQDLIERG